MRHLRSSEETFGFEKAQRFREQSVWQMAQRCGSAGGRGRSIHVVRLGLLRGLTSEGAVAVKGTSCHSRKGTKTKNKKVPSSNVFWPINFKGCRIIKTPSYCVSRERGDGGVSSVSWLFSRRVTLLVCLLSLQTPCKHWTCAWV